MILYSNTKMFGDGCKQFESRKKCTSSFRSHVFFDFKDNANSANWKICAKLVPDFSFG